MHDVRDYVVLARDARTSTTYKPALLKSIVRLQAAAGRETISLLQIADQFARLYWTQTVVFHLRQAASISREPEVLRALRTAAAESNCMKFVELPQFARTKLVSSIARTLKIDVLKRFHSDLPDGAEPLYVWDGGESLTFSSDAVSFIQANAMTLDVVANHWWARFLEKVNMLAPKIIQKIEDHGVRRTSLLWFYARVAETDAVECFYCRADLSAAATIRHVDHVIPWSFLLADPVWDLVFACQPCNLQKSDRLPHRRFINKLEELNHARVARVPSILYGSDPLAIGGLSQLYDAARGVEWPNGWEPHVAVVSRPG